MELLKPGIYDSALTWAGKAALWDDVMQFTAEDRYWHGDKVHGVGETIVDGCKRRLVLWLGQKGVEGVWVQHTLDGYWSGHGHVEFERQDDRWYGMWQSGADVSGLWVLSPR